MLGQSIKAKIHKHIKLIRGMIDKKENQPENPAFFKILLTRKRGIDRTVKMTNIMTNSCKPKPPDMTYLSIEGLRAGQFP